MDTENKTSHKLKELCIAINYTFALYVVIVIISTFIIKDFDLFISSPIMVGLAVGLPIASGVTLLLHRLFKHLGE